MPPIVYNPASGTPFPRAGGTIYWYNGHTLPSGVVHAPKNAISWRLLVGSTSYGEDYHSGNPIPAGNPLRDNVFNRANPPHGQTCYAVPEYTLSGGGTSYGTVTTFVAN